MGTGAKGFAGRARSYQERAPTLWELALPAMLLPLWELALPAMLLCGPAAALHAHEAGNIGNQRYRAVCEDRRTGNARDPTVIRFQ